MLDRSDCFGQAPGHRIIPVVHPADCVLPTVAFGIRRAFVRVADKRLGGSHHFAMDRAHLLERMGRTLAEIGHETIAARLELGEERAFLGQTFDWRGVRLMAPIPIVAVRCRFEGSVGEPCPDKDVAGVIKLREHLFRKFRLASSHDLGAPGIHTPDRGPTGDKRGETGHRCSRRAHPFSNESHSTLTMSDKTSFMML